MICKSITMLFFQDRQNGTERKRQTDKACFLAESAFLNNAARSDFCCLETAFFQGRSVSLETSFECFNHERKDRVS